MRWTGLRSGLSWLDEAAARHRRLAAARRSTSRPTDSPHPEIAATPAGPAAAEPSAVALEEKPLVPPEHREAAQAVTQTAEPDSASAIWAARLDQAAAWLGAQGGGPQPTDAIARAIGMKGGGLAHRLVVWMEADTERFALHPGYPPTFGLTPKGLAAVRRAAGSSNPVPPATDDYASDFLNQSKEEPESVDHRSGSQRGKPEAEGTKLWCQVGKHFWFRARRPGRQPSSCPEHSAAPRRKPRSTGGNPRWIGNLKRCFLLEHGWGFRLPVTPYLLEGQGLAYTGYGCRSHGPA